jgi:iron complex outermembrane receptor protein
MTGYARVTGRSGPARRWGRRAAVAAMLGASALTAPFAAAPALAQDADNAVVDDRAIIVTAQRRAEAVEDVPMTVTVLTQDTLANSGVNSIRDLQNVTSGFSLNQSGTYPQPAIRGVTTTNSGSYENNVALWVDGLYQITPQVLNMDLPNVQNVQVLKGPQGALYGRNATGGAILIDTIDPGDEWNGNLEATYGRFDDRRARGYVSGPLSEGLGISLAGTYRKTDGYYKKVSLTDPTKFDGRTLGLDQQSVRAKIKADLSDSFRATIAYNYTRASDPRGAFFTPFENLTANFAPRKLGEVAGDAFELDFRQHEGSLKLEWDIGIGTLRSVTGYQKSDLVTVFDSDGRYSRAGISPTDSISDSLIREKTWQENVDLTIDAIDGVDLIVGGTWFRNRESFAPGRENVNYSFPNNDPTAVAGTPLSAYRKAFAAGYQREKEAYAAFFDATIRLTDALSLNVGGRYSKENQDIHAKKTTFCANPAGCVVGMNTVPFGAQTAVVYDANGASTYKKFTPRASIRYEIAPRTNIYASFSQGFKAGEWNGVIPFDDPAAWEDTGEIGQETVDAFEVGIKGASSRVRFDLAGFYYKYKNLQVSSVQFVNGVTGVLLQNIPRATIKGVEGNIDFDVTDNFTVRAGATWLHARYGKGAFYRGTAVNPAGTPAVPNPDDPLKALPNIFIPPAWQDISGMQMVRAPDFTAFAGFEYKVPNGDGGLTFAGNAKYTSSYVVTDASIWGGETNASYLARLALDPNATPDNNQIFNGAGAAGTPYLDRANQQRARQSGYVLVNASVTWTDPSDSYYVRLWGNNLTDKIYKVHYRPSSRTYAPIGEPRTFGVTLGMKFRENGDTAMPPPPPPPPPPLPPGPPPPPAPPQAVCNKGPYIVFFDWDKADITPEAGTILDSAVTAYASCDRIPIMLAGYTDRSGSAEYNMGLAERRNGSVRGYLTGRGIADGVISSQAFGESNPRVPTADGVRELQNRRVEITYGPGSGY